MSFFEYFWHTKAFHVVFAVVLTLLFSGVAIIAFTDLFRSKEQPSLLKQPPSSLEWKVICVLLIATLSPLGIFLAVSLTNAHSRYLTDEKFLGTYELTFQLESRYDDDIRSEDRIIGDYAVCSQAKRVFYERMGLYTKCLLIGVQQKTNE